MSKTITLKKVGSIKVLLPVNKNNCASGVLHLAGESLKPVNKAVTGISLLSQCTRQRGVCGNFYTGYGLLTGHLCPLS